MTFKTKLTLFALCLTVSSCSQHDKIILDDFEQGTFIEWIVEGDAFGKKPVETCPEQKHKIDHYDGNFFVNSFHGGGCSKGKLTFRNFTIQKKYINFLLGGENHSNLYVELAIEGQTVFRSRPHEHTNTLDWITWNVKSYKGKKASILIVDEHDAENGYILVDHFEMSNQKRGALQASR